LGLRSALIQAFSYPIDKPQHLQTLSNYIISNIIVDNFYTIVDNFWGYLDLCQTRIWGYGGYGDRGFGKAKNPNQDDVF